jgi:hypothetical protein
LSGKGVEKDWPLVWNISKDVGNPVSESSGKCWIFGDPTNGSFGLQRFVVDASTIDQVLCKKFVREKKRLEILWAARIFE